MNRNKRAVRRFPKRKNWASGFDPVLGYVGLWSGVLTALIILLIQFGCGGGTSGTGLDQSSVQGSVKSLSGEPIQGVTVVGENESSSDTSTTDDDGNFKLKLLFDGSEVSLLFSEIIDGELVVAQTFLTEIPVETEVIEADFEFDRASRNVRATQINYRRRSQSTPDQAPDRSEPGNIERPGTDRPLDGSAADPVGSGGTTTEESRRGESRQRDNGLSSKLDN